MLSIYFFDPSLFKILTYYTLFNMTTFCIYEFLYTTPCHETGFSLSNYCLVKCTEQIFVGPRRVLLFDSE